MSTRRPRHFFLLSLLLPSLSLVPLASLSLLHLSIRNSRRSEHAVALSRQPGERSRASREGGTASLQSSMFFLFPFLSCEERGRKPSEASSNFKKKSELQSASSSAPLRSGSPFPQPLLVTTHQRGGSLSHEREKSAVEWRQGSGKSSNRENSFALCSLFFCTKA